MEGKMLCEDMLLEIMSWLPVKSLMRFMFVSKYFQSLILHPRFVTMHLENSRKKTSFLSSYSNEGKSSSYVFPSTISSLIEEDSEEPYIDSDIVNESDSERKKYRVLGSCNGLVCLTNGEEQESMTFDFWNPATTEIYENPHSPLKLDEKEYAAMLGFGYDNSTHTYKVVVIVGPQNFEEYQAFRSIILSMNEEIRWREIEEFPADPTTVEGDGIYINNSLNWLGIYYTDYEEDGTDISFDEVVIVSLDLETETYTEMSLPDELNGVLVGNFCFPGEQLHCNEAPLIGVLSGCLSLFLHNRNTTYLSIWQMKKFGNKRSWTLLLNTSLHDLGFCTRIVPTHFSYDYHRRVSIVRNQHFCCSYSILIPLCIIENDRDIVIIHNSFQGCVVQTIIYNLIEKTVTYRTMSDNLRWIYPMDYVESLVSPELLPKEPIGTASLQ
ncbi:hypothetical protein V8G54_018159 [Vigna mungo]|uniref:F-box domain-containing protein n=1 Tax=Vigna mungo TaxID=3915 RepID=A0AAQ3NA11_VIGMU